LAEKTMSDETTAPKDDPLQAVVDAMQAAVESAKEGAVAAQDQAARFLPQASRFASRFVYTTCYTVSYGVVFPSALLALSVPRDNAFVHGLIDGAHAAREKVDEMLRQKPATDASASPAAEPPAA
jgi:hypothetical protein